MLTRAQNYTVPKKPFVRNRDALAFTTIGVANKGGANDRGHGSGGHMNKDSAKTCYQCNALQLIRDLPIPPQRTTPPRSPTHHWPRPLPILQWALDPWPAQ